jgi:hypothetical protein
MVRDAWVALTVFVATSAIYWIKAENPRPLLRVGVSIHGVYFLTVFLVAMALTKVAPEHRLIAGWLLIGLEALGLVTIALTLSRFEGPRMLHLLLIPLVGAAFYAWFIAGMAVAHDWL